MAIMAVIDKKAKKARNLAEDFQGIFTVPATDLRKNAHDVLGRVEHGGEDIILTRHGKPQAALVSIATLKAIRDAENAQDLAAADAAERDIAKHGTVPWAEVKRRNGL